MPNNRGFNLLAKVRYNLTRQLIVRPLKKGNAKVIKAFIVEDIIFQYKYLLKVIIDSRLKNKAKFIKAIKGLRIYLV